MTDTVSEQVFPVIYWCVIVKSKPLPFIHFMLTNTLDGLTLFLVVAMMQGGVTSPLQMKAQEIRTVPVNWQSYKQGQMISLEEYGVITRLEFHHSDAKPRAEYLRNNSQLVSYVKPYLPLFRFEIELKT